MFHVKHWLRRLRLFIKPEPAIVLPKLVIPPDVPRETSRPTYKELMMKRDHFLLLRNAIFHFLDTDPEISGAQVTSVEVDPDTHDLLVTAQFGLGDRATVRTHRITFTEESVDVPRETSET